MQNEIVGFRLSAQQMEGWNWTRGEEAGHAQCVLDLVGDLDTGKLRRALVAVIERHEILRTHFLPSPGLKFPVQVIAEEADVRWRFSDEDPTEELSGLVATEGDEPFDVEKGPLVRAALLRRAQCHNLVLTLPVLLADRATLRRIVAELADAYAAADEPEVMQYVQFSEWQHAIAEDPAEEQGWQHWQGIAGTAPPLLPLPVPRETAGIQQVIRRVDKQVLASFEKAVGDLEVETSTFFLACWAVLLGRLIRRREVMVHTVFDGRKYEELEEVLGPMARRLPIRVDLIPERSFSESLRRLTASVDDAWKWQEFAALEANPEPAALGFEFVEPAPRQEADGVEFVPANEAVDSGPFQLALECHQQEEAFEIALRFHSGALTVDSVAPLADQLTALIHSVAAAPQSPLSDLQMLDEATRRQLVVEWNDGTPSPDRQPRVQEMFQKQAMSTPRRIAVVFEEQSLDYTELNHQANRLAHYLRTCGVGPEAVVALCLERSLTTIVAMLATLKAGGAYLPLDPTQPARRLATLLADASPTVVLTDTQWRDKVASSEARILDLDQDREEIETHSSDNPETIVAAENLAYVLFTSGSTGRPKGVGVAHRQLSNYVVAADSRLQLKECSSFALVSTLAADLGNTVLFPSLCVGGTLHVISETCALDPQLFADYLARHPIDCLKIVPTHLSALQALGHGSEVLPKRRLILGGEASHWERMREISDQQPTCTIFNHYGPTEATVGVSAFRVDPAAGSLAATVPLGRPLANLQVYVLDGQLRALPYWMAGEIFLAGAGLTRGYLGRPSATAERFLPNPFGADGERLYRTGDLARHLPSGELEFLGRVDHQVKVRGFRVELGEIEATLRLHTDVEGAVAAIRPDPKGEPRIIAYVVSSTKPGPGADELDEFLAERLPGPMIPARYVSLNALPLSSNGKVNRQALPEPEFDRPDLEQSFVAPRNETEEFLAAIWRDVLSLDQVGVFDNFFVLGGDSILAVRVVAVLKEKGLEISLQDLFRHPTISALADFQNGSVAEMGAEEVTLDSKNDEPEVLQQSEELSEEEVSNPLGEQG